METIKEIIGGEADRPVIINNEAGCGQVVVNVINVNNVTNNTYTHPEWFTEELLRQLVAGLHGKGEE